MVKERKGVRALNPLTILYMIIVLAVVAVLFDYRVTLLTVAVMILIAVISGVGAPYVKLWMKSMLLICIICFVLQSLFIPG